MRLLGDFEPHFHCACAELARILLPVSDLTTPFNPAWSKTYIVTKFWLKTQFKWDFEPCFTAHAQKRPEYYFRYQIWPRHSIRHARKPICLWNCGWKCYFKGTLKPVCTAHAQKGQNTTSGFRFDHAIRSGMVENLYSHEILAKNAILVGFWAIFYCACAETARILLPVSNLTVPFDSACPKTFMSVKLWLKTLF